MIAFGSKARDKVTGFTGIVIARTQWITGCDRYTLQPQGLNKEGKHHEPCSFDEPMLEVLETPAKTKCAPSRAETQANPGGPRPEPARRK